MKNLVFALLVLFSLAGCKGDTGPMGPSGTTGPQGPGKQVAYSFSVLPLVSTGSWVCYAPAITSSTSIVVCYLIRGGAAYQLNTSLGDCSGVTSYAYTFNNAGSLTVVWANSASVVPPAFNLAVTVVED